MASSVDHTHRVNIWCSLRRLEFDGCKTIWHMNKNVSAIDTGCTESSTAIFVKLPNADHIYFVLTTIHTHTQCHTLNEINI